MPTNPIRLLQICEDPNAASHNDLRKLDRELLPPTQHELRKLKRDVERTLLRLSFLDEQSLN